MKDENITLGNKPVKPTLPAVFYLEMIIAALVLQAIR